MLNSHCSQFAKASSIASYSAMLLLHLSDSAMNCRHAAYHNSIPEGDFNIATAPAPETPQAPSQYTCHDESTTTLFNSVYQQRGHAQVVATNLKKRRMYNLTLSCGSSFY
jgi:hypothetical protein